jgi:hypothetical protein
LPVGYPNQIPSNRRVLQANKIPEDVGEEGKTFQAYSMPSNKASLNISNEKYLIGESQTYLTGTGYFVLHARKGI